MVWFNKRCTLEGYRFDSLREMHRYQELKLLADAGAIACLEVHPRFELAPAAKLQGEARTKPALTYTADFRYLDLENFSADVIEDVKSKRFRTTKYRIKKHLMKAVLGLDVVEVE